MDSAKLIKSIAFSVLHLIVVIALTSITQIGGIIYLISILILRDFSKLKKTIFGLILYFVSAFFIIPFLAVIGNRVPLPITGQIAPYTLLTCLLNRHYVTIETRNSLEKISSKLNQQYDGASIRYLDANFPFFDGFPLLPHLSHSDGKKLDLAFHYKKDDKPVSKSSSFIGYGFHESPLSNEINYPNICRNKGYWKYDLIEKFIPVWNSESYSIDVQRTKLLIRLLNEESKTDKIFIEPHLQNRWGLASLKKIRFHGCHAVRHDDHIHWQIK